MLKDQRNQKLAKVFIDYSLEIKKGDKLVISTSDLSPVDLVRESMAQALQKGAHVYLDVMGWNWFLDRSSFGSLKNTFYEYASEDQIKNPPEVYKNILDWGDKFLRITTLDNFTFMKGIDPQKVSMNNKAYHDWFHEMIDNKPWVLTNYPTDAFAQQAGMSTEKFTDFYFDSVLVDYTEMKEKALKIRDIMDAGKKVHIVGEKTDLWIDIEGRLALEACGEKNVPDGEVFMAPVHTKTEGYIYYDTPFFRNGVDINGAYLEFKDGKVVKATAEQGLDVLMAGLDTDEGAKYLGELGLGINYNIQNVIRNTLFDEKIGGTVHVTLGEAYGYKRGGAPEGEKNVSAIHWDMVKDMRKKGCKIEVDGKVVFEEGKWLV